MIRVIEGRNAAEHPLIIDAMHKSRAEVFHDRLGWDVVVKDGRERDRFDDANPLYLISVDPDSGAYQGSVRLLPTTGPNMLRDVFPQLLDANEGGAYPTHAYVESATIWESSRICQKNGTQAEQRPVLNELILGLGEVAVSAGLTQIVSVFDARMYRILSQVVGLEVIGTPQRIGGIMCYAALFDCGEKAAKYVREKTGITTSVLALEMVK